MRTIEFANEDITAVRLAVSEVFSKWSDELDELDRKRVDKSDAHYQYVYAMAHQYGRILKRLVETQESNKK